MKGTAFLKAAVPDPARILGVRLKPFSVGHNILLQREGCALVDGRPGQFSDLILGVSICSRTFEEAVAFLSNPLRSALWLKWWGFKVWLAVRFGGKNLAESAGNFLAYVRDGSSSPTPMQKDEGGSELHLPITALVLTTLQSRCGYSLSEAMNCPWGLALWQYAIVFTLEGKGFEAVDPEWISTVRESVDNVPVDWERLWALHRNN
jgi:hypothetical protein